MQPPPLLLVQGGVGRARQKRVNEADRITGREHAGVSGGGEPRTGEPGAERPFEQSLRRLRERSRVHRHLARFGQQAVEPLGEELGQGPRQRKGSIEPIGITGLERSTHLEGVERVPAR